MNYIQIYFNKEKSQNYVFQRRNNPPTPRMIVPFFCFSVCEAYNMGVPALILEVLVVLGQALRVFLRRFGMKCRTPVRRHPAHTKDRLRRLEEGPRVTFQKSGNALLKSDSASNTAGLGVNVILIKINQIVYTSYSYTCT